MHRSSHLFLDIAEGCLGNCSSTFWHECQLDYFFTVTELHPATDDPEYLYKSRFSVFIRLNEVFLQSAFSCWTRE